jgi:superfamily I DNA and/or RNA helicase
MSVDSVNNSKLKKILQRLDSEFDNDMRFKWLKEPKLWMSWFELNWEYWVIELLESDYETLSNSVLVVPRSIYELEMGLVGLDWDNPNHHLDENGRRIATTVNLDFPLTPLVVSDKDIMREVRARIDGALGVIKGILRHQQEFGKAKINPLKQDLYDNLDIPKCSNSYNSDEVVFLRENDEDAAIKTMQYHKKVIDAFLSRLLQDETIIEKNGEYIVSND